MGQKVNPIANRLGIIRGWDSNWFGGRNFGDNILEDSKIRKYLDARLANASVSRIVIERTPKIITITVCTSRPGLIIGKGGAEVDKLKEELKGNDTAAIKAATEDVQKAFYAVSEKLYQQPGAQGQPQQPQGNPGDDVVDADYESVD